MKLNENRTLFLQFFSEPHIPNIPNHEEIKEIFQKAECDLLNWNSEAVTFPKFVQLIQFESYTYHVLLGLICSVGGMTETLVKKNQHIMYKN